MNTQTQRESKKTPPCVDMSDNFLQRAVDRLENSGSKSALVLFALIAEELLSIKTPSN